MIIRTIRILLFVCSLSVGYAQSPDSSIRFFDPAPELYKGRLIGVTSGLTASYTATMIGLSQIWYSDAEQTSFHFFNDGKEWLQVDKMGHMHTAYFETVWATQCYRWAGVSTKKAAWFGALTGWTFQSSIEIFDGFSEKWGASGWDVLANTVGSGLALSQYLAWGEQRIRMKYSFHSYKHQDKQLADRSASLYGETHIEQIIKDYNSLIIWISANPASFMKNPKRATWLNVAVGYAGGDMYGGFDNEWEDEDGNLITRYDVEQYRRFFISLDVDLDRIPVKNKGVRTFLSLLNIVKMPTPAIEFNTKRQVVFHPMLFLNWNVPVYLKK